MDQDVIEQKRLKLVAAVLSSFSFDVERINALTEDEQVMHTETLTIFAMGVADTALEIMLNNPFKFRPADSSQ